MQTFFLHGIPAARVEKSQLAVESTAVKNFLHRIQDPQQWFGVILVQPPVKAEPKIEQRVQLQPVPRLPKRSSSRIRGLEQKAMIDDMQRFAFICVFVCYFCFPD